ncbi:DUF1134 domain-containing protein [Sphingopyxis macrogoltabida]|uniref:DUF1134 domain-containing protein n=1 Tax=Sphingopyxis macrogoltabida TaxID=33050 RepID=A0AAC8YZW5_SPHMC|nr:DUF1134 domain-containing protein [Sphingopyxis macrogoltabida]ALJ13151.1 hypothetical protein LH19_09755 [Sphingopyxis macrogoltabida]AMU89383.1 hypothetical protein ATM17_10080 [Sphingopyxis macrogoltabida]
MRNKFAAFAVTALAAIGLAATPIPAAAQMTQVDPNTAIDSDLDNPNPAPQADTPTYDNSSDSDINSDLATGDQQAATAPDTVPTVATNPETAATNADPSTTYKEDDLIGAAEGVFGKGAQGLASMIEDILKKQGEPNAYIVGREASGALVLGVRYGSGTLYHKVEGERPAYWTGPSIGFDAGANAGNTFVLVYNLFDSEDLYKRFPAGEGAAYLIGGFNASYLRSGDIVLIPIRVGVGARLGANVGYMKFRKKQSWVPF